MWNLVLLFVVTSFPSYCDAMRYRTCQEGCCVHEYCAYHRICYPKIHCRLGCPDGVCVGRDQKPPAPHSEVLRQLPIASSSKNKRILKMSREIPPLSERYSYKDSPDIGAPRTRNTVNVDKDNVKNKDTITGDVGSEHDSRSDQPMNSPVEVTDGICMPYQPCVEGEYCGMGHSCTFNYNLGYNVCQYNLDIGSTLCYDNKGRPAFQSLS